VSEKSKARAAMTKEADALVKKLLISERGYRCEKCLRTDLPIYSCHIKSKGPYTRLRFEKLNLLLLCYRDHIEWNHKEPDDFIQWLELKWPGRLQTLRILAGTAAKVDLKELLIGLRYEVKNLLPPHRAVVYDPIKDGALPF
jgi:hypothetical protein